MLIHALLRRRSDSSFGFVNITTSQACVCQEREICFTTACTVVKYWPPSEDMPKVKHCMRFSDDFRKFLHPNYESLICVPCCLQDNIIYMFWRQSGAGDLNKLPELFEPYWRDFSKSKDERVTLQSFDKLYLCDIRREITCDTVYIVGRKRWVFAPRIVHYLAVGFDAAMTQGTIVFPNAPVINDEDLNSAVFDVVYVNGVYVPGAAIVQRVDATSYTVSHNLFLGYLRVAFASVAFNGTTPEAAQECRKREALHRRTALDDYVVRVNNLLRRVNHVKL
jgi:hypothetical protein